MVPMLTCGLVRSNFAFATGVLLRTFLVRLAPDCAGEVGQVCAPADGSFPVDLGLRVAYGSSLTTLSPRSTRSLARRLRDDLLGDVRRNLVVRVEHHAVARPSL